MNKRGETVEGRSDKGLEILQEAFRNGETILEFSRNVEGDIMVTPITEHVETLEEKVGSN